MNGGVGSVRESLSAGKFDLNFLSRMTEVSGSFQKRRIRRSSYSFGCRIGGDWMVQERWRRKIEIPGAGEMRLDRA